MKDRVRITDVSPRDGLQNEAGIIPTADKLRLIELLCATGVDEIEVTSFVSPKWVPQLGDAETLLWELVKSGLIRKSHLVLVPNVKGMERLLALRDAGVGIDSVAVFTAASETFCQKNTNCSIAESLERFDPIARLAAANHIAVRGYVSCAIACPFEGPIDPGDVARVVDGLMRLGIDDIDVADTIGAGTAETTKRMLARTMSVWHDYHEGSFSLHLHDTFGRAADCVKVALDMGVRSFDGSVAGLGGCPYASKKLPDGTIQRAPGNISTELLVQTIEDAGYETGVDREALAKAAAFAREIVAKSRTLASEQRP